MPLNSEELLSIGAVPILVSGIPMLCEACAIWNWGGVLLGSLMMKLFMLLLLMMFVILPTVVFRWPLLCCMKPSERTYLSSLLAGFPRDPRRFCYVWDPNLASSSLYSVIESSAILPLFRLFLSTIIFSSF